MPLLYTQLNPGDYRDLMPNQISVSFDVLEKSTQYDKCILQKKKEETPINYILIGPKNVQFTIEKCSPFTSSVAKKLRWKPLK